MAKNQKCHACNIGTITNASKYVTCQCVPCNCNCHENYCTDWTGPRNAASCRLIQVCDKCYDMLSKHQIPTNYYSYHPIISDDYNTYYSGSGFHVTNGGAAITTNAGTANTVTSNVCQCSVSSKPKIKKK